MLSSLCEKRGFPLKDIAIYLHGKDKVNACLLCTHHNRWTQVLWIVKQTSFFLNTVAAAIISGPGLFCPQRPAGHFRAQSEVRVSQHFLPLFFGHPSRHSHPHPQYSTSFVTICKTKHVRSYIQFPAEILLISFHQWPTCRCQNSNSSLRLTTCDKSDGKCIVFQAGSGLYW